MFLSELFDSAKNIEPTATRYDSDWFVEEFEIGKDILKIEVSNEIGCWDMRFTINGSHALTKAGNEFAVFSAVVNSLLRFNKKYKPEEITFSADSKERAKLYTRIFSKVLPNAKVKVFPKNKTVEAGYINTKNAEPRVSISKTGIAAHIMLGTETISLKLENRQDKVYLTGSQAFQKTQFDNLYKTFPKQVEEVITKIVRKIIIIDDSLLSDKFMEIVNSKTDFTVDSTGSVM